MFNGDVGDPPCLKQITDLFAGLRHPPTIVVPDSPSSLFYTQQSSSSLCSPITLPVPGRRGMGIDICVGLNVIINTRAALFCGIFQFYAQYRMWRSTDFPKSFGTPSLAIHTLVTLAVGLRWLQRLGPLPTNPDAALPFWYCIPWYYYALLGFYEWGFIALNNIIMAIGYGIMLALHLCSRPPRNGVESDEQAPFLA